MIMAALVALLVGCAGLNAARNVLSSLQAVDTTVVAGLKGYNEWLGLQITAVRALPPAQSEVRAAELTRLDDRIKEAVLKYSAIKASTKPAWDAYFAAKDAKGLQSVLAQVEGAANAVLNIVAEVLPKTKKA